MPPSYLSNTLAPPQQPTGWVDPYEQQRAALQARMAQEPAPMFSEEEAARRVAQNKRDYQMGLIAASSGDEAFSPVGGMVLKNAIANRQQRVTERGTADPLTGKFTYSPEYLRQMDQQKLDTLNTGTATSREKYEREMREEKRDKEMQRQRAEDARELKRTLGAGGGGMGSQAGVGPNGEMVFRNQQGLFSFDENGQQTPFVGKLSPKPSGGGNATDGEKQAAGFAGTMQLSTQVLDKFEETGAKDPTSQLLASVPRIGDIAARRAMTPQQQQFDAAARAWVRAKLRKESGATIGEKEMDDEILTYFPQPEDGQDVRVFKRALREQANRGMEAAAGRAAIVKPKDFFAPKVDASGGIDVGARLGGAPATPGAAPAAAPQQSGANPVRKANF